MGKKNVRDRLHEVFAWLKEEFPVGQRVRLRVEQMPKEYEDCEGLAYCYPPVLIRVRKGMNRSTSVYTLLHEYAHVGESDKNGWPENEDWKDPHSDSFYRTLGKIERAWALKSEETLSS